MQVQDSNLLNICKQLIHYLERVRQHLKQNQEKLFDLHVLEALKTVFYEDFIAIERFDSQPKKEYNEPGPMKPKLSPESDDKITMFENWSPKKKMKDPFRGISVR